MIEVHGPRLLIPLNRREAFAERADGHGRSVLDYTVTSLRFGTKLMMLANELSSPVRPFIHFYDGEAKTASHLLTYVHKPENEHAINWRLFLGETLASDVVDVADRADVKVGDVVLSSLELGDAYLRQPAEWRGKIALQVADTSYREVILDDEAARLVS